jgi:hypothetical protein
MPNVIEIRKSGNRLAIAGTSNRFLKSAIEGELASIPEDFILTGVMSPEGFFVINKNSQTEVSLAMFMQKYLLNSQVFSYSIDYSEPLTKAGWQTPMAHRQPVEGASPAVPAAADPGEETAKKPNRVYLSSLPPALAAQYQTNPPEGIVIQTSARGKQFYEVGAGRTLKTNRSEEDEGTAQWQRRIEQDVKQERAFETERALNPPWMDKYDVAVEEIGDKVTRYSRANFKIDLIERGVDFAVRENGKIVFSTPTEKHAYKVIEEKFKNLSETIPPKAPPKAPELNPNTPPNQMAGTPGMPAAQSQPISTTAPLAGAGTGAAATPPPAPMAPPPMPGAQVQQAPKNWPPK